MSGDRKDDNCIRSGPSRHLSHTAEFLLSGVKRTFGGVSSDTKNRRGFENFKSVQPTEIVLSDAKRLVLQVWSRSELPSALRSGISDHGQDDA